MKPTAYPRAGSGAATKTVLLTLTGPQTPATYPELFALRAECTEPEWRLLIASFDFLIATRASIGDARRVAEKLTGRNFAAGY